MPTKATRCMQTASSAAPSPKGMRRPPLAVIDLFCGGGGVSQGVREANTWGHALAVLAVDADKHALAHHARQFPRATHLLLAMGTDTEQELLAAVSATLARLPSRVHIHLHGSPPCQGFSMVNTRRTKRNAVAKVKNNHLSVWFLQVVPKIRKLVDAAAFAGFSWSYENVERALPWLHETCTTELKQARHTVTAVVRASELGGATLRTRVFLGDGWIVPVPTHTEAMATTAAQVLGVPSTWAINNATLRSKIKRDSATGIVGRIRDAMGNLIDIDHSTGQGLVPCNRPYQALLTGGTPIALWRPVRRGTAWRRVRSLTAVDLAKLQGFPPSFVDNLSFTRARKLIGNSVPPAMFAALLDAIGAPQPRCAHCGAPRWHGRVDGQLVCKRHSDAVPSRKRKFGFSGGLR